MSPVSPQELEGLRRGLTTDQILEAQDHDRAARQAGLDAEEEREVAYEAMGLPLPARPVAEEPAQLGRGFLARLLRRR